MTTKLTYHRLEAAQKDEATDTFKNSDSRIYEEIRCKRNERKTSSPTCRHKGQSGMKAEETLVIRTKHPR